MIFTTYNLVKNTDGLSKYHDFRRHNDDDDFMLLPKFDGPV